MLFPKPAHRFLTSRCLADRARSSSGIIAARYGRALHHYRERKFENIVVRANSGGSPVRVKDVARVELGRAILRHLQPVSNGAPAASLAIFLAPKAGA